MEAAFPFILQNLHRIFLYLAFIPLFFLWLDAFVALHPDGAWRLGLGNVILFVNIVLLTGFSLSCNSLRHLVGGRLDCFSCTARTRTQYSLWQRLTGLNVQSHALGVGQPRSSVALADLYIRLLAIGPVQRPVDPAVNEAPERHPHDVLVIGAGGAGLRAAIAAAEAGGRRRARLQVAPRARPTRSWPRAASPRRSGTSPSRTRGRSTSATRWSAASCSTTRGWPSSTPRRRRTGSASSRPGARSSTGPATGGSSSARSAATRYPRLAHVGDRTGLEMIRTLQDRAVAAGITVYMECTSPTC